MKKMSQAISNLGTIKTGITTKVNALSSINYTSSEKAAIKSWYHSQIDDLISDIRNLKTPMYFGYNNIVSGFTDVIIIGLQYIMFTMDTEQDLWEAIDPDNILDAIKNLTVNDVWNGAVSSGTHPTLSQYSNSLQAERRNISSNLESMRSKLAGLHGGFTLEPFLEQRQPEPPAGMSDFPSVQQCATIMYMDWGLLDIVSDMDLDIYIPTYVR